MSSHPQRRSFLKGAAAVIGAVFVGRPKLTHALPPAPLLTPDEPPAVAAPIAASHADSQHKHKQAVGILSLSSGFSVLPGTAFAVTSKPQISPFRVKRVIISNPHNWIVHDFRIGLYSQLGERDQPGEQFSMYFPQQDPLVRHDICQAETDIAITASYVGSNPYGEPFICGVLGFGQCSTTCLAIP